MVLDIPSLGGKSSCSFQYISDNEVSVMDSALHSRGAEFSSNVLLNLLRLLLQ
jgi:hypothetical protein